MNQFVLVSFVFFLSFYTGHYPHDSESFNGTIPAPQNLNASDGSFPGKINILWDKVQSSDDIIYLVYRGETPAIEDMKLIKGSSSKKNHAVDRYQLIPNRRYYYRVRAGFDSQNISAFSEADSGFIRNIALPPLDSLSIPVDSTLTKRDTLIRD
jgi:hypothetical protein